MLHKNLSFLRKQRNQSQDEVAKALNISRATYASYENHVTEPNAGILIKIGEYFGVYIDDLLNSDLGAPIFRQPRYRAKLLDDNIRLLIFSNDNNGSINIEFVSQTQINEYEREYHNPEYLSSLPRFQLPNLNGSDVHRAFELTDNTMLPLGQGSILIGRYIKVDRDLVTGYRYIFVIKNKGVLYRRFYRHQTLLKGVIEYSYILLADSPSISPISIDIDQVLEVWEMRAFIGSGQIYKNEINVVSDRLQLIEHKLISYLEK